MRRSILWASLIFATSLPAVSGPATDEDLVAIRAAMEDQLKDADSARFKDVVIGEDGTTCGKVNAKNSYGAYAGFEPFLGMKLSSGKYYIVGVGKASGQVCEQRGF